MAGSDDSEFGGLGATIYEIVTMPKFTGANLTDTPTYHDPSGMSVAMRTAFTLESQPPVEALQAAYANVAALEEQTPATSSLIDWSAKDIRCRHNKIRTTQDQGWRCSNAEAAY